MSQDHPWMDWHTWNDNICCKSEEKVFYALPCRAGYLNVTFSWWWPIHHDMTVARFFKILYWHCLFMSSETFCKHVSNMSGSNLPWFLRYFDHVHSACSLWRLRCVANSSNWKLICPWKHLKLVSTFMLTYILKVQVTRRLYRSTHITIIAVS